MNDFIFFILQIKLLQGAANAYNFIEDAAFDRWFDSILILDEREAYKLSCTIECENMIMSPVIGDSSILTTKLSK